MAFGIEGPKHMHLAGQQRIKSARENRALLSAAAHVLCMHGIVLVLAGRRALLGHSPVTPCTGVGGGHGQDTCTQTLLFQTRIDSVILS